jgi:putative ABC transport system permease protein
MWNDIRYGARTLRKAPGFTAVAVITLALGIGATTAVFSVCDALLWKPVPLPHLETMATVLGRVPGDPNGWNSLSAADFEDIRRTNTTFQDLAMWDDGLANIVGSGGEPERVSQFLVSPGFFDLVGVQPSLGRGFQSGEDEKGRDNVVMLSDKLWRRRFGADPQIVGKTIRLDDANYLVTGVMPPGFDFPRTAEIWTPLTLTPKIRNDRAHMIGIALGRLKPGRTLEQAGAELESIGRRLASSYPETNKNRRFMAWSTHDFMIGSFTQQYTLMLFFSVLFVLAIACANVANLQFARATGRTREVAVRTALGARQWQIAGQLVTESVMLSVAGAVLGLLVAGWGIAAIKGGMPAEVEKYIVGWKDISLDARALGFSLFAAVLSGVLAGLAPAIQCSWANVSGALKEGGRGGSAGRGKHRLRGILVAAEIALAVVLLVGASLMVRGFNALLAGSTNMEPATILSLRLAITENKYHEKHQQAAFYREVLERTSKIPGVRSAVAASALPYSGHSSSRQITIEGRQVQPGDRPWAMYQSVSPNYFETLRIPLKSGRLLSSSDGANAPLVAVISDRLVRLWWPNGPSPVGRRIKVSAPDEEAPWITIVGVAGDITHDVFDRTPRPTIYLPFEQSPRPWMDIGVRAAGDPLRLAPAVTASIRSVDPEQPVTDVATIETLRNHQAVGLTYVAVMMGIFGVLALVLASVGVYGVMAYLVAEQTHDIGVRVALGAPRQSVLALVFRQGMLTTIYGLLVGMALAWGMARLLASLIFGVSAGDAATFIGIPLALLASAALAILVPARRAMRVDPIVALRCE